MNSTNTNVGGWKDSAMRTYANGDFFNKLPSDLQSVIKSTKVVSGHGSSDENGKRTDGNWESEDKIYLLSAHEVWEDGTSNQVLKYDTAANNTRQLDYYANLKVTTNNYSGAIKKNNGSDSSWWLRAAYSDNHYRFLTVYSGGAWNNYSADNTFGLAPAFRIG